MRNGSNPGGTAACLPSSPPIPGLDSGHTGREGVPAVLIHTIVDVFVWLIAIL